MSSRDERNRKRIEDQKAILADATTPIPEESPELRKSRRVVADLMLQRLDEQGAFDTDDQK